MPDLSGTFQAGDVLDLVAKKVVDGDTLVSNTIHGALTVSFAGPPVLEPDVSPASGTAFGGTVVEITGSVFTPQSQVLFGTQPARLVVFASPGRLLAVAPALPVDAPDPGLDLQNADTGDATVDGVHPTDLGFRLMADWMEGPVGILLK